LTGHFYFFQDYILSLKTKYNLEKNKNAPSTTATTDNSI